MVSRARLFPRNVPEFAVLSLLQVVLEVLHFDDDFAGVTLGVRHRCALLLNLHLAANLSTLTVLRLHQLVHFERRHVVALQKHGSFLER